MGDNNHPNLNILDKYKHDTINESQFKRAPQFYYLTINGTTVEARSKDNFINATQLCKAGGKHFRQWHKLASTRELIKNLEQGKDSLIVEVTKNGSWIHPQLATLLAQWISPLFSTQISQWIEEWKYIEPENEQRYAVALSNLQPSKSSQKEKEIQMRLKDILGARTEVKTPVGFIDCLSERDIVEIKQVSKWKHALGQILCYGTFYPTKTKHLYLFGDSTEEEGTMIKSICSQFNVQVTFTDMILT